MVTDKVKNDNVITNDWLSKVEIKNHMLIYIEDNGNPLKLHGSLVSATERQMLFEEMIEKGTADGLDIKLFPFYYTEINSGYYRCRHLCKRSGEQGFYVPRRIKCEKNFIFGSDLRI